MDTKRILEPEYETHGFFQCVTQRLKSPFDDRVLVDDGQSQDPVNWVEKLPGMNMVHPASCANDSKEKNRIQVPIERSWKEIILLVLHQGKAPLYSFGEFVLEVYRWSRGKTCTSLEQRSGSSTDLSATEYLSPLSVASPGFRNAR